MHDINILLIWMPCTIDKININIIGNFICLLALLIVDYSSQGFLLWTLGLDFTSWLLQLPPVTVQIFFRLKRRVDIDLKYHPVHFDLQYSLLRLFFNVASFDKNLLSPY